MKILFSPSEGKKSGGTSAPFSKKAFLFPPLFEKRQEVLQRYHDYLQNASDTQLSKLFGIKDLQKCQAFKKDIFNEKLMPAIERYDGVAFDYLDYSSLGKDEKVYINTNTIIFSNLFGPLLAGDKPGIPTYKLKQGEKIEGFAPEVFYKKHFSDALDEILGDAPYLDLRAGFYNKFYKPTSPHTTLKFIKNGKVVSHWAKAYRGIVLRELALHDIKTIDAFKKMPIKNLRIKEILEKGHHTEMVFDIVDDC